MCSHRGQGQMGCTRGAAKATSKAGASQSLPSHCTGSSQQAKISVKSVLPALPRIGDVAPIRAKHLQGCVSVTAGSSSQLWVYGPGRETPCVGSRTSRAQCLRCLPTALAWLSQPASVPQCLRAGPVAQVLLLSHCLSLAPHQKPPASLGPGPLQGFHGLLSSFCIPSPLFGILPEGPGRFPCSSALHSSPKVLPELLVGSVLGSSFKPPPGAQAVQIAPSPYKTPTGP